MNENPFDVFESKSVRPELSNKILKTSSQRLNPGFLYLSIKYGALFISSVFLSLSICPQRGVGLFGNDFPLFHHLLHQSQILCGLYCGLMFFLTTHLLAFFLLTHFERLKIVSTFSYLPLIFVSGFFGLSMTSVFSKAHFDISYSLSWIAIVGLCYVFLNYQHTRRF